MKINIRILWAVAVFISLFAGHSVQAQGLLRRLELGTQLGTFVYQGDLTPNKLGATNKLNFNGSLYANYLVNHSFALRLQYMGGHITADDASYSKPDWRQQRNFYADTRIRELALLGVWDLKAKHMQRGIKNLDPYLLAGLGVAGVNVHRDYSRINSEYFGSTSSQLEGLATDNAAKVPRTMVTIPVGAGLRYGISKRIGITAEAQYRFAFNDYLDGFKAAANPNRADKFYSVSLGLVLRLGNLDAMPCPTVNRK